MVGKRGWGGGGLPPDWVTVLAPWGYQELGGGRRKQTETFSVRLASARGEGLSLLACRFVAYYRGRYVVVIDLDAERGAGGGGWGRQSIARLVTLAHSHVCHHAGAEPLAGAWW